MGGGEKESGAEMINVGHRFHKLISFFLFVFNYDSQPLRNQFLITRGVALMRSSTSLGPARRRCHVKARPNEPSAGPFDYSFQT